MVFITICRLDFRTVPTVWYFMIFSSIVAVSFIGGRF